MPRSTEARQADDPCLAELLDIAALAKIPSAIMRAVNEWPRAASPYVQRTANSVRCSDWVTSLASACPYSRC